MLKTELKRSIQRQRAKDCFRFLSLATIFFSVSESCMT